MVVLCLVVWGFRVVGFVCFVWVVNCFVCLCIPFGLPRLRILDD